MATKRKKTKRAAYAKPASVIKDRLERFASRSEREGYPANVVTFLAPDGSYEGESRIILDADDAKDIDTRSLLIDVSNWLVVPRMPGLWVSSGVRFHPSSHASEITTSKDRGRYDREHGMISIGTYSQRATQKASNFRAVMEAATSAEEALDQHAAEIFVRLIWTPANKKPVRRGKPIAKRSKRKVGRGRKGKRVIKKRRKIVRTIKPKPGPKKRRKARSKK